MMGVSKTINRKEIIKDISLSFYYGAKIGVLGLNGSGKSTLLKIMAGLDTEYEGKITAAGGYPIGYLEQEPLAGETRTVLEVVEEGVGEVKQMLADYDAINEKFAEEMTPEEMEKLLEKQGDLQEKARTRWRVGSRCSVEHGHGSPAMPTFRSTSQRTLGW